ncbi:hypothetical protein RRG08_060199 [Elysia crispata]|uniref:Uncharacterized protein n=1 Tax=Elysia crispata TaxID=231223 RepID=A0AAE1DQR9_9GAST|nr:hypothetical protein RRG08_060199 [Elysia crispata]
MVEQTDQFKQKEACQTKTDGFYWPELEIRAWKPCPDTAWHQGRATPRNPVTGAGSGRAWPSLARGDRRDRDAWQRSDAESPHSGLAPAS